MGLSEQLAELDGRSFGGYRGLRGSYVLRSSGEDVVTLFIDHVQGDPFAAPSRVRLRLAGTAASYPAELRADSVSRVALADAIARRVAEVLGDRPEARVGSGHSGRIDIDAGGQEVLARTAIRLGDDFVEARLRVGLPARGRRILGRDCATLLCDRLPEIAIEALAYTRRSLPALQSFVQCVVDQETLRGELTSAGLVAFVADGAILPRRSGDTDEPLLDGCVRTVAPPSLRREFTLRDGRRVAGLGIPAGVTLVVGGGFHGKSTLLQALARGVYPHIPGDGREGVITRPDGCWVRAEEGRRIEACDIRAFIGSLPGGRETGAFATENASGSTSQAAAISEALEVGARLLLMDEDTCATNFMVRDERMRALIASTHEPITPFVDRARSLFDDFGVSTILVTGASGDYFRVADRVIEMRDFQLVDRSADAAAIASKHASEAVGRVEAPGALFTARVPGARGLTPRRGTRAHSLRVDRNELAYGERRVPLASFPQFVDRSQAYAAACAIDRARRAFVDGQKSLSEVLDALEAECDQAGLESWVEGLRGEEHPGELARPRRLEIAGVWNRLRGTAFSQHAL